MLSKWLSDQKGGTTFSCFGIWHVCYLLVVLALLLVLILSLKNRCRVTRQKVIKFFINSAFALYIADFFLMPFAYGEIDVEKLPFHICTAMCVMCFWSRHNAVLGRFRHQFALLGFISNLVYLIYPAGVMWYQVHPLSYRVIQTLLFHSLMTIYGLLVLIFDEVQFSWKKCYKDFIVIVLMTIWALFGNTLYCGEAWGRSYNFNWFFVTQDPFYLLPKDIAPYIMPPLNIVVFFAADLIVYSIYRGIKKLALNRAGLSK